MYFKTNLLFAGILVSIDSWSLVLLIQAKDLWSKKLYVGTDLYNYQERKQIESHLKLSVWYLTNSSNNSQTLISE